MCKSNSKIVSLMKGLQAPIDTLLTFLNIDRTVIDAEYAKAIAAVQNWKPGTPADDVIQVVGDLLAAFNALPVPDEYKYLATIIVTVLDTVLSIVEGNTTPENADSEIHAAEVTAKATAHAEAMVPTFKLSKYHSPEAQVHSTWNAAIDQNNGPATLKV